MTADSVLRRRNGRPQACDPCRARKVACDHTQPVCQRCRKRGEGCVYTVSSSHAAALTTSAPAPAPASGSTVAVSSSSSGLPSARGRILKSRVLTTQGRRGLTSSSSSPVDRRVSHTTTPSHPQASSHPSEASASAAPSTNINNQSPATTIPPSGPGYLGYTSYSTIYQETRDSLSQLQGTSFNPVNTNHGHSPTHQGRLLSGATTLSSPTREMCLVILRSLPDLSNKVIHPRTSCSPWDGWVRIAGRRILQSLQVHLPKTRDESRLRELADLMCRNTSSQPRDDLTDPEEWIGQFVGQNVRWESLGMLFTFSELLDDHPSQGRSERYQGALEYIDMCIDLAMCLSGGNIMLLFLCFRRTILESMVLGDAGLSCWRAHAETVSLLTFLGLHADTSTPPSIPTFCSELRRKIFAHVFNIDKVVSFQGRPPFLSRRFISTPLPLDIPDEVFFESPDAVERAVAALDQHGWNRETADPSATTTIRARTLMAIMRDELMEISLGNNEQTPISTLLELKAREADIVAAFPPSLRHTAHDVENPASDIESVYTRMLITLEHFQNLFFVERLLLRRGHPDNGDLLLNSFEMVTMTLTFWMHKDRFVNVQTDFEWLVMSYAAPGGGILCMELLKPTFTGPHPKNPTVSRSTLVQQLSLLVGFLGWVSPDAPNAELCANCRTVIQHVLDHTLNAAAAGGGGVLEHRSEPLEALEQFDANQLNFNMDLLDTFDWLRADEMPYF